MIIIFSIPGLVVVALFFRRTSTRYERKFYSVENSNSLIAA